MPRLGLASHRLSEADLGQIMLSGRFHVLICSVLRPNHITSWVGTDQGMVQVHRFRWVIIFGLI